MNQAAFEPSLVRALPPDWAAKSIFYQIFPDRFYNGQPENDRPGTVPWDAKPTYDNFFGGDLQGIIEKIPYLNQLGITAVYLNPIFKSPSNHKYNTSNYLEIAPEFGDFWTFKRLIDRLHQAGIKIILDGVFNHTGDSFWAFQDVMRHGEASRFKNWYHFRSYPVCQGSYPNYECWWNFGSLPKLNHRNPEVLRYLLKVVAFWTSMGIDGWRLDVPNEVPMDFWRAFRRLVIAINPEAFIIGEIWDDAHPWLGGDTCDAVMNYRWRDAVVEYFAKGTISAEVFRSQLAGNRHDISWNHILSAYNLLGSHDTPRFLTVCGGDRRKLLAALTFQFTYPGIPAIYYGDEIGLEGDKDPDCRKTMKWDPAQQDGTILKAYQDLIDLRRRFSALQTGSYYEIFAGKSIFSFVRTSIDKDQQILVCVNMTPYAQQIKLSPQWEHGWEPLYAAGAELTGLSSSEIPSYAVKVFKR